MKENEDYELIPADIENEQAWDVRILTGEFVETIIRFGNVEINGKKNEMKFNFIIIFTPDDELSTENINLQKYVGEILGNIIDNNIQNESVIMDDK